MTSINTSNQNVTFKGGKLTLKGKALKVGDTLPSFILTALDMSDYKSDVLKGKIAIISIVPSVDTPVCSVQTKHFNKEAAELGSKVAILTVSRDLPFAQKRWCGAEGVSNVTLASDYKNRGFGEAFGAEIVEWGLLARAVVVADSSGKVQYLEYVPEISAEPQYEAALKKVRELL